MSGRYFLDTNVLVYTFDSAETKKRERATTIVAEALREMRGVISYQVVQEFINVATRKFERPLAADDCARYLETVLAPLCEVFPSIELYREALEIHERWQLRYHDALIVTAALRARCDVLYSEDLAHGLKIRDLTIENPFATRSGAR